MTTALSETNGSHVRAFALMPQVHTQAVRELANREGWQLIVDIRRGHRNFRRLVWQLPAYSEVNYFEDHVSGSRFLVLATTSAASLDGLATTVCAALALEDESAVLDRLEGAVEPTEIIATVLTLGTFLGVYSRQPVADDFSPRLVPVVTRLAEHPVRHVRMAVLITMSDLAKRWPSLAAPLLARRDEETELTDLMNAVVHVVGSA